MFNQIFVSYLVRKNILAPKQAQEVLVASSNVMNVIMKTGVASAENKPTLLKQILCDILCDNEYMKPEQLDICLDDFKAELNIGSTQFENLLKEDIDTYLSYIAGISDDEWLIREYAKMFIATTLNYINTEFFIKKAFAPDFNTARYVVSQNAEGDAPVTFMFASEDSNSATKFAEKFENGIFEVSDELDDKVRDSLKEFLNCVTGLLTSELFNKRKIDLDIEVPEYHSKLPVGSETIILPFSLLHIGEFYIFIKRNY